MILCDELRIFPSETMFEWINFEVLEMSKKNPQMNTLERLDEYLTKGKLVKYRISLIRLREHNSSSTPLLSKISSNSEKGNAISFL